MAVNSKSKGNAFERKIANRLSERFKEYLGIPQGFRRDSTSGSFFGASNQKRLETHDREQATFSDIIAPKSFLFSIECKNYKTAPSFASLVKGEFKLFDTWIGQASQDAKNSGKKMLIVVKFNSVPEFVIVRDDPHDKAFAHYRGYSLVTLEDWLTGNDLDYFSINL